MIDTSTRNLINRAGNGETLTEDEMTRLYNEAPYVLREANILARGLAVIAEAEGATADELRQIAQRFLGSR